VRETKRIPATLACEVCGSRNYRTTRRKEQGARQLMLKKFCSACGKHTVHRETK